MTSEVTQPPTEIPLRILVQHPPPGVTFAMQHGTTRLIAPTAITADAIQFDVSVRLAPDESIPRLLGPIVHGPPATRFLYVNSGLSAGLPGTCWNRRAKVPLAGVTWALICAHEAAPDSCIEARIVGTARDGGPCCASVPLLGEGWRVVPLASR